MFVLLLFACQTTSTPSEAPLPTPTPAAQLPSDNQDEPSTGRWNRARPVVVDEEIAALEAIGYVGSGEAAGSSGGVTVNRPGAMPGVNFYVSGHAAEATLVDNAGKVLHQWSKPFHEVWPDRKVKPGAHGPDFWRRAALLPDGGLLAIYEGHGLVKLDANSKVVWSWDGLAHHDLEVLPDGRIWVLSRKARLVSDLHPRRPVLEDFASLLSPAGEELKRISILDAVRSSAPDVMNRIPKKHGDIFHTNSLEVLGSDRSVEGFAPGHLLLSMRATSTVLVLDPEEERVTWSNAGVFKKQHDPTILANGNLLLFDNLGLKNRSAVREYSLPEMKLEWSYTGGNEPFFSRFCGASQRLDNGNTLISESGVGRALEVTPQGEVVWTFDNPARAGEGGEFVAILPELVRLPLSSVAWLPVAETP